MYRLTVKSDRKSNDYYFESEPLVQYYEDGVISFGGVRLLLAYKKVEVLGPGTVWISSKNVRSWDLVPVVGSAMS